MRAWVLLSILCLFAEGTSYAKKHFPTVADDGKNWDMGDPPGKLFAIGDIHGDFDALAFILKKMSLIDNKGVWKGGNSTLVMTGDLVDRGPDSRLVIDFVMDLQEQARGQGGRIEVLLGNHELLILGGAYDYVSKMDLKSYEPFKNAEVGAEANPVFEDATKNKYAGIRKGLSGYTRHAEWLRGLNAMFRAGDTFFDHGGIHEFIEYEGITPGAINSTYRAWIRFFQGVGPEPAWKTFWVTGFGRYENSPVWTRTFKEDQKRKNVFPRKRLNRALDRLRVRRIVTGHNVIEDMEIVTEHPFYGDRVVMIDTAISKAYGGNLRAIEIAGGEVIPLKMKRPKIKDVKGIRQTAEGALELRDQGTRYLMCSRVFL